MRKLLRLLTLTAAVLAGAVPAQATVIDFDTALDTTFATSLPLLGNGDFLIQGDYYVGMASTKGTAQFGDFVGTLVNGTDVAATCFDVICPTNNATQFLAMLNDGLPYLARLDGGEFQIDSFDASFIAASRVSVPSISMLMLVVGWTSAGDNFFEEVLLPGPVAGAYGFSTYELSDEFSNRAYIEVDFYGYSCNADGNCSRSNNTAQFALDNISLIPEPASLALVGLAIAGMTTLRRRRQVAA